MGTLANSVFQGMLGWIQRLIAELWNSTTSPESATLTQWIGKNWKILAGGLCILGLVADLVIYLIRWQPYRVWRSFLHGGKARRISETSVEEPDISGLSRDWRESAERLPPESAGPDRTEPEASGTEEPDRQNDRNDAWFAAEKIRPETESGPYETTPQYGDEDRQTGGCLQGRRSLKMVSDPGEDMLEGARNLGEGRKPIPAGLQETADKESLPIPPESGMNPAVFAPQRSAERKDSVRDRNEPQGTTAAFDQALRPRRRRSVARLFQDGQEEAIAPNQLIDQYAAYRRPVYPRSWKAEEEKKES